jgi:hypothetical protein
MTSLFGVPLGYIQQCLVYLNNLGAVVYLINSSCTKYTENENNKSWFNFLASERVESGSNQRTGKQDKFELDILPQTQGI